MIAFHVTYETITEESAANGDVEDRGFIMSGGHHVDVANEADREACQMSLREALRYVTPQENSGSCFSEVDGDLNYRTGEREYRSLHPPRNITPASYRRLVRLFKLR